MLEDTPTTKYQKVELTWLSFHTSIANDQSGMLFCCAVLFLCFISSLVLGQVILCNGNGLDVSVCHLLPALGQVRLVQHC